MAISPRIKLLFLVSAVLSLAIPAASARTSPNGEIIRTVAGGGPPGFAVAQNAFTPASVVVDHLGNVYFDEFSGDARVYRRDPNGVTMVVAGTGNPGSSGDGGPAVAANVEPGALAVDGDGNLYIVDSRNSRVRRVNARTGIITTVAGDGRQTYEGDGGPAVQASFEWPVGIAVDAEGNLYVTDSDLVVAVRRIDSRTGIITRFAGGNGRDLSCGEGPALDAAFLTLSGIATDSAGNLFVIDWYCHAIRRIDAAGGFITTYAGGGPPGQESDGLPATRASIEPVALALDTAGNLYFLDNSNQQQVRRVDAGTGLLSTVAGGCSHDCGEDGVPALKVRLNARALAFEPDRSLLVADLENLRIGRIDLVTGIYSRAIGPGVMGFAGDGGPALEASLFEPYSVAASPSLGIFFADTRNHVVRRVDPRTGLVETFVGSRYAYKGIGPYLIGRSALEPGPLDPSGVALAQDGTLYVSDYGSSAILAVDTTSGLIIDVIQYGTPGVPAFFRPVAVTVDQRGRMYAADSISCRVYRFDPSSRAFDLVAGNGDFTTGGDGGSALDAGLVPGGIAIGSGGDLFISDVAGRSVRRVDGRTGIISTVAGNGSPPLPGEDGLPATAAGLAEPKGLALDPAGNLFVADAFDNRVRRIDAGTGIITTAVGTGVAGFSGDGGPAQDAQLTTPRGLWMAPGGSLYIADSYNHRIREVGNGPAWTGVARPLTPQAGARINRSRRKPPQYSWTDPSVGAAYRIEFSRTEAPFLPSLSSGPGVIEGTTWTPDQRTWRAIRRLAGREGRVYWRVVPVSPSGPPPPPSPIVSSFRLVG